MSKIPYPLLVFSDIIFKQIRKKLRSYIDQLLSHEIFNVASGDQISLNEMVEMLLKISVNDLQALCGPKRAGVVKHSKAKIYKLEVFCGYDPKFRFREGLDIVYEWYETL